MLICTVETWKLISSIYTAKLTTQWLLYSNIHNMGCITRKLNFNPIEDYHTQNENYMTKEQLRDGVQGSLQNKGIKHEQTVLGAYVEKRVSGRFLTMIGGLNATGIVIFADH